MVVPKQVFGGRGSLKYLNDVIAEYGQKALIVTGKSSVRCGSIAKLQDILENNYIGSVLYTDVAGEPTEEMVEAGKDLFQKEGCDFLIGIGGGSPLDAMKAIATLVTNPGKISDYMGKEIPNPVPPMIAIPTTAGTGSEATWFTIITDTKKDIKMFLKGESLMPDVAVVDSELSVTTPKNVTAATGLDALTHAIEAYTSKKATDKTDEKALSAVKRIFKYLPIAYENGHDLEAREEMSIAALEAGMAFNNSSVTLVHGMSRPIGALFHVPHGISNAMLLGVCLEYALSGTYEKFGDLGRIIGVAKAEMHDEEAAKAFLVAVKGLCDTCEVPSLEKYGIKRDDFVAQIEKMSADAIASGSPANTRREIGEKEVADLYRKLWE